jgi:hypothetical protein
MQSAMFRALHQPFSVLSKCDFMNLEPAREVDSKDPSQYSRNVDMAPDPTVISLLRFEDGSLSRLMTIERILKCCQYTLSSCIS